ncbi:hypothetical protein Terro_3117 [Terriglobus roseus DSM 18391]|uniref:Lipoprotein n=1 Tax=Terriglobus roseus (strain DSM 18391 / NRRL B-41598 / KBS 63) TaxID=926566 RepID=I3ZJC9_TERRK|nr:hypothetical protein Terro_3117 [Terriglobus roseus DSM 18391]
MTGHTRNAYRKTISLFGLLAISQLQGCLMAGHAPSVGTCVCPTLGSLPLCLWPSFGVSSAS